MYKSVSINTNHYYDLIMVTTFVDDKCVYKLIKSIADNNKEIEVLLILIIQTVPLDRELISAYTSKINLIIVDTDKKLGISAARNIGIDYVKNNHLQFDFLMFPDDDTTFDNVFFKTFKSCIKPGNNYLIPIYNEGSFTPFKDLKIKKNGILSKNDFKYAGSPNIIVFNKVIQAGILFDEQLGVGGNFGSSEDVDFYLKSYATCPFLFTNKIYNFHPSREDKYKKMSYSEVIKRFRGYSSGYIYVMLKYKKYYPIFKILFTTFGASVLNLLKGNWKMCRAYLAQFFIRIQLVFQLSKQVKNRTIVY